MQWVKRINNEEMEAVGVGRKWKKKIIFPEEPGKDFA